MKLLALVLVGFLMTTFTHAEVTKQPYGHTQDGTAVDLYTLKSEKLLVGITTYGGIIVKIETPDRSGKKADVVLGFDSLEGYTDPANKAHFGALIGRYANRIAHAKFTLDGTEYNIPKNDGDNALHGGPIGFDKAVWKAKEIKDGIELSHVSPDGDQGFPGKLSVTVRYILAGNELRIAYTAATNKASVLNLTNHSYFNLTGDGSKDVLKHRLKIAASRYTPVDATLIPTGELAPVAGSPFDFQNATEIGARIEQSNDQLKLGHGYDHNFVLTSRKASVALAAVVTDPSSGRTLEVLTDQPGIQLYSGNFLDGSLKGKGGLAYQKRAALCLETQHFPDSPNRPSFPTTELKPG
ncbi:MAG: aldose epimerase family protein, partial [Bacteroidota bacterium]